MSDADAIGRLILLAPIEPAPTGNGLAMRCELFRLAVPSGAEVQPVVVPVAGRVPDGVAHPGGALLVSADRAGAQRGAAALLADPVWRDRLARAGRLPDLARAASPALADTLASALPGDSCGGRVAVHVMRSYLAPLGAALAERVGARWITLDLDEDDAAYATTRGDREEASSYERLLASFGELFDGLSAASPREAEALGERHGLVVEHVPNAVALPRQRPIRPRLTPRAEASLLFVGNLTYPPNIEAAHVLVEAVLPRVERRLGRRARLTLVGPHLQQLVALAGPHVQLAGFIPDLTEAYASADVVVAPLRSGGGTRIKLLEAFAHDVPVVASSAAAAGLEVSDRRHLLLADDADQLSAAIVEVLTDASISRRLVEEAGQFVRERYSTDVVIPTIRDFYRRAADRGRVRRQPSDPCQDSPLTPEMG